MQLHKPILLVALLFLGTSPALGQTTLPGLEEAVSVDPTDLLLVRKIGDTRDKKVQKATLFSGYSPVPSCAPPAELTTPVNLLYLGSDNLLHCSGLWLDLDESAASINTLYQNNLSITVKSPPVGEGSPTPGSGVAITAGSASGSTETTGAAAGGDVLIMAGTANGLTSGSALGGHVLIAAGAGWENGVQTARNYILFLGGYFVFNDNEINFASFNRSYTFPDSSGTVVLNSTLVHKVCTTIESPTATDNLLLIRMDAAATVTGTHCLAADGTSVVATYRECDGNGANCSDIEAAMTCGTTNTTNSGSIDNSSLDAGDWVRLVLGTNTGTVTQLSACIYYTVN